MTHFSARSSNFLICLSHCSVANAWQNFRREKSAAVGKKFQPLSNFHFSNIWASEKTGGFLFYFLSNFFCFTLFHPPRPSDPTVPEDAGIEFKTIARL
jgi:hypothetical protein